MNRTCNVMVEFVFTPISCWRLYASFFTPLKKNLHSPVFAPQNIFLKIWRQLPSQCPFHRLPFLIAFSLLGQLHLDLTHCTNYKYQVLVPWLQHYCNSSQPLAEHDIGHLSHKLAQFLTSFCPSQCQPSFSTIHHPENPRHSSLFVVSVTLSSSTD